ncbi:DNA-(apurinic or apyrimidinic site) lyase [Trichinella pseudospiralis]|uniref:DNA-(Apurinic or apyrimidinic site) lyase n=1 Tax=Trichinella pseudospiralis TaxID=6337 RepID=A0A0V1EIP4_TRIPS|nr:DNA-(apurinic or apyrimidinic site) lyase [Trichinella pseudospiralis]KRZ33825.1 DNA-(apurinic or apyrimidinic site) lyase [Trichinella pseudospiralis]KRZ37577.1 DNA-(apurinic or apyrimidinic site) lyase [Trichinella pseudospiralis]
MGRVANTAKSVQKKEPILAAQVEEESTVASSESVQVRKAPKRAVKAATKKDEESLKKAGKSNAGKSKTSEKKTEAAPPPTAAAADEVESEKKPANLKETESTQIATTSRAKRGRPPASAAANKLEEKADAAVKAAEDDENKKNANNKKKITRQKSSSSNIKNKNVEEVKGKKSRGKNAKIEEKDDSEEKISDQGENEPSVSAAAAAVNSRQLKKRTNNNIEEEEEEATAPAEMAKEDVNVDKGLDLEAPPKKRNAVTKKSAATVVVKQESENTKEQSASDQILKTEEENAEMPPAAWFEQAVKSLSASAIDNIKKSSKLIGGHLTTKGSLGKLPENAAIVGCRSFSLFLRSNMNWRIVPLKEDVIAKFKENCEKYGFDDRHIIPHGCYLLNAVSTDAEIFRKTCETLLFEVQSCEKLGIKLYAFHPGSTRGIVTIDEACSRVAKVVNEVIAQTKDVVILLECMAGQGFTVGNKFEDLKKIIDSIENKDRIGVCLDTCHIFAAGYDIKNKYEEVMEEFDKIIGFQYLKGVHLNDSKGVCGSKVDRHEVIGKGKIGEAMFKKLMNDARFDNIPMVLETPAECYTEEINLLYNLID